MMLQFLQCKTFGNQALPEGWLIVAAGNPPEYNKSVRDFDVVTLDRVKRIDVEEDYGVWKEYARRKNLHGAILSYLDIKKDNFYRIETTVDGLQFATARGWEDLSELIYAYEKLGLRVDREVVGQYIQLPRIAKDFANYLELFYKYQKTYHVEDILSATGRPSRCRSCGQAPFDEKLSVMGLVLSPAQRVGPEHPLQDALSRRCTRISLACRETVEAAPPRHGAGGTGRRKRRRAAPAKEAGQLDKEKRDLGQREAQMLEDYRARLRREEITVPAEEMDALREWFAAEVEQRRAQGAADRRAVRQHLPLPGKGARAQPGAGDLRHGGHRRIRYQLVRGKLRMRGVLPAQPGAAL